MTNPTARVRRSYHPHQSKAQADLAHHLVLDTPMTGRLKRDKGDALCRPAVDFYELERDEIPGDATCRRCLDLATRHSVTVITTEPQETDSQADSVGPPRAMIRATQLIVGAGAEGHTDTETVARRLAATPGSVTAAGQDYEARRAAGASPADAVEQTAEWLARAYWDSARAKQPTVEGVIVEHAGTAQCSRPADAAHPDVAAARDALSGLAVATMTDHHDVTEPTADERDVRGYLIEPHRPGTVRVYWLEAGRIVRHDQMPHGPALDCIASTLTRRGWTVRPLLRSSPCVVATRPSEAPAAAEPGEDLTGDRQESSPVDFHDVRAGDRLHFLTRDTSYEGRGIYPRVGTVSGVHARSITVACDDGSSAALARELWREREPQRLTTPEDEPPDAVPAAVELPTDVHGIAEIMTGDDDSAVNALYDRLTERLGYEEASRLWRAAGIQVDHEAAIDQALSELAEALTATETAARRAQQATTRLASGDAWHPDYAESTTGSDINRHLEDALRSLRAATALHRAASD